jgi:hypothetical protein
MRYETIDRCKDPFCDCLDKAGIILYRGGQKAEALAAKSEAKYPDPEVITVGTEDRDDG